MRLYKVYGIYRVWLTVFKAAAVFCSTVFLQGVVPGSNS